MSTDSNNEVNVLQLSIHGVLIGYLAGFRNGRNVLSIAGSFKNDRSKVHAHAGRTQARVVD